jgi:LuxR family maltose regulon positive regulatory protein
MNEWHCFGTSRKVAAKTLPLLSHFTKHSTNSTQNKYNSGIQPYFPMHDFLEHGGEVFPEGIPMVMSLLQTKLHAPAPPSRNGRFSLVSRPRLLHKLNSGIGKKLTLICAPAGFGKSTLLREWIDQSAATGAELQAGVRTACAAAWLSLDAGDNDAIRFWTYFIAALQTLDPAIGKATLALLQSPQAVNHELVLTSLLNDVAERSDLLILVLDDYHLINTPAIHRALLFLLDHLPAQLHIVLSSRADPPLTLARWRGQGLLTELRIDDLRFTADEAAGFLEQVMGLQLSPEAIAALESRTEGWVAGLQLAALSLQGIRDRDHFITRFSGSNRYILDYLVEEVLSQQSEEIQHFLLQTSILEQMCGPLCDAVVSNRLNSAYSTSQEILEALEQANLFLIPLDDERHWFRYHHLFSDVLRIRLRKEQNGALADLHRRASIWHEETGQIEAAVSHALAIPDVDRAASLVESVAMTILLHHSLIYSARQLIEQIPLATIQLRPRLTLAYGITLSLFGQFDTTDELLANAAKARNLPDGDTEVAGGFLVLRSLLARFRLHPTQSLELAQQALENLPADDHVLRAAAFQNIGLAYIRQGKSLEGQQMLTQAAASALAGKANYLALVANEEIATEQRMRGQLTQAKRTCEGVLIQAVRWGANFTPAVGIIHIVLGEVLYERNELANAIHSLTEGLQMMRGTTEMNLLARGFATLAGAQRATGEADLALLTLQQGEDRLDQMQLAPAALLNASARLTAQRAQFMIHDGEIASAQQWAATTPLIGDTSHGCTQRHTLARLRIAQYQRDPQPRYLEEAKALLAHVAAVAEATGWMTYRIENLLLHAIIFQMQRERAAAQDALLHALTLGQSEGYVRTFVDEGEKLRPLLLELRLGLARKAADEQPPGLATYLEQLLTAMGPTPATKEMPVTSTLPTAQPLVEPLTEREIEILRLVDDGLSNNEIADKLIVTVGTVKKHLNNIFGKLGVTSRTQALAGARALNLF